jgi:hypothetical protein
MCINADNISISITFEDKLWPLEIYDVGAGDCWDRQQAAKGSPEVEFDDLKSFDSAYPSQHTSVTRATIVLGKAIFDCVHVFI